MTPEQQTAFEARRDQMQTLAKTIAAMSDTDRQALAASVGTVLTCEQRPLSPHNTCMLAHQRPDATVIGGFQQWKRLGRAVRKGEKGSYIWVPLTSGTQEADHEGAEDAATRQRFRLVAVFDVSQTDEDPQEESHGV
jgi:hypothetical protein